MDDSSIICLLDSHQNEKAFNAIVEAYSERLYWHIRRFGLSHDDTDDLLQDIFIKIWAALPSFRGEARLFTWIYRIATNEALNFQRKKDTRQRQNLTSLDGTAFSLTDDPYFDGDRAQELLMQAISRLPDKQRMVFNLRYFEEMEYAAIAQITGTSVGALKASYHFAHDKIMEEIEKEL